MSNEMADLIGEVTMDLCTIIAKVTDPDIREKLAYARGVLDCLACRLGEEEDHA